jgi:hypothetical protein
MKLGGAGPHADGGVELQAAGVRPGRTEALFRLPAGEGRADFQPARDGRRFLVQEPESASQDRRWCLGGAVGEVAL